MKERDLKAGHGAVFLHGHLAVELDGMAGVSGDHGLGAVVADLDHLAAGLLGEQQGDGRQQDAVLSAKGAADESAVNGDLGIGQAEDLAQHDLDPVDALLGLPHLQIVAPVPAGDALVGFNGMPGGSSAERGVFHHHVGSARAASTSLHSGPLGLEQVAPSGRCGERPPSGPPGSKTAGSSS